MADWLQKSLGESAGRIRPRRLSSTGSEATATSSSSASSRKLPGRSSSFRDRLGRMMGSSSGQNDLQEQEQQQQLKMLEQYESKANDYYKKGNLSEALVSYNKALEIAVKEHGEESSNVAKLHNKIAMVYHTQENYTEALKYYSMSLCLTIATLGETHPNVANAYNNIAIIHQKQHKYEKALEYNNKALDIKIARLGDDHPHVANTYNNIAVLYEKQKNFDQALIFHQKSLTITLHKLGTCHPYVANSYTNMANVFDNQKSYEMSLQYYNKALEIKKIILLKQHEHHQKQLEKKNFKKQNASTDGNFNFSYSTYNTTANPEDDINNTIYNHPNIANTYHKMANVYAKRPGRHNFEQALLYYNKAIEIYEGKLKDEQTNSFRRRSNRQKKEREEQLKQKQSYHTTVIQICNDIASLYINFQQRQHYYSNDNNDISCYDKAIYYYDKVLQMQLSKFNEIEQKQQLQQRYQQQATIMEESNNDNIAENNESITEVNNSSTFKLQNAINDDNIAQITTLLLDIAQTYLNLADIYQKQSLLEQAIRNYLQAKKTIVKIILRNKEQDDSATIVTTTVASVTTSSESFSTSTDYEKNSDTTSSDSIIQYPEMMTKIYNSLATAHYRQGDYEIALEYHNKTIKLNKKVKRKNRQRRRQEQKRRQQHQSDETSNSQIHDDSYASNTTYSTATTSEISAFTVSNNNTMDNNSNELVTQDSGDDYFDNDLDSRENLFWAHLESELNSQRKSLTASKKKHSKIKKNQPIIIQTNAVH